jgi:hypothetical protein
MVSDWIGEQRLRELKLDGVQYPATVSLDETDKNTLDKIGHLPIKRL